MELILNYNLQEELDIRNKQIFSFSSLDDMRNKFFQGFREEEKRRGCPLSVKLRAVSDDWEVLENGNIALMGDELEFSPEMLLEGIVDRSEVAEMVDDTDTSEGSDASESVGSAAVGLFSSYFNIEEKPVAPPESNGGTSKPLWSGRRVPPWERRRDLGGESFESERGSSRVDHRIRKRRGYSSYDEPVDVVERPIWGTKREDTDTTPHPKDTPRERRVGTKRHVEVQEVHLPSKRGGTSSAIPREKVYTNLVDFIKDHPNCSVSDASGHFSSKEIQKNIKLGKVYLRGGKLSI